jgi:hypothetical protein
MKKNALFIDEYAVSELVGAMFLIIVAIVVFSAICMYVFPLLFPPSEPNVQLRGYVTDDGIIVIEHIGGESLTHYRTDVKHVNGTLINRTTYQNREDPWEIGECNYPLADVYLLTENDAVHVTIYNIDEDGNEKSVFDGILTGKGGGTPPSLPSGPLMLISSLRTNTTDEDLICFNYTIEPDIDASTYIYNWSAGGNSIMNLLVPFDINSSNVVKDYSGNKNNGTVFGPVWMSEGVVGGAYSFDGVDDYISLPYCFDSSFIDEITVEAWIKTDADSGVVASFDRDTLWELGITNGVVRWSTNANDGTTDMIGVTSLNDGSWHHIAATYDSSTGNCTIYVDGETDRQGNGHTPGESLGSGDTPDGFIGISSGGDLPMVWDVLTYDDFEAGFGNYTDGGRDCRLYTGGTYAHQGSNAANIQDNGGIESSFYHTNEIDVDTPGYTSIMVDFWFRAESMETGEDFWVRYYNGSQWHTVADYDSGDEFVNGQFYHKTVWINETDYTFPSDMKIRFQCDASSDWDDVYIDQVYVNGTTGGTSVSNFSGYIDEFRIYNRALSAEQIYQNYLCTKDGFSDKSVIVSEETSLDNIWKCTVTPNDSSQDDTPVESNTLQIVSYSGGE